jgi:hypothetical protein
MDDEAVYAQVHTLHHNNEHSVRTHTQRVNVLMLFWSNTTGTLEHIKKNT